VLNADSRPLSTYPLSIVDAKDAVQTVFRERVSVVETWPEAYEAGALPLRLTAQRLMSRLVGAVRVELT
jgi:hypothetical protein